MLISRRRAVEAFGGGAMVAMVSAQALAANVTEPDAPAARVAQPRIHPLGDDEISAELKATLTGGRPVLNVMRTLFNAPAAAKAFVPWAAYILSRENDLSSRQCQLVILRTAYLCKAQYEWAHHAIPGASGGLTAAEIARTKHGADAPGWSAADAVILRACDELHGDQFIGDATWASLAAHFTQKQCMDVVFTASQYTQLSMMLNSFGVQLEPEVRAVGRY
jgi:alkylhydroperoxidase family enzyme